MIYFQGQKMNINAILFDMDGVLIEAKDWHYEALNQALDLFGMPIDRHAHLATFDGLPTKRKLEMLGVTHGLPQGLHSFINEMKQNFTETLVYSRCRPTFHHQFALSKLKRSGYKIAVCSNSIRATVQLMMQLSSLEQYLDLQLSNEDVSKPKPAPDIYLAAMDRLNVKPENCLIVEDNDHGVQAAVASGGHVMRVATTEDVTYERIMAHVNVIQGS